VLGVEEGEELAIAAKCVPLAIADVLNDTPEPATVWIVVALGGSPDPNHERLHVRDCGERRLRWA